ncbi:MAG TPA: cytochrome b/b6 domain-containing protein [Sphingomicrobium sp.]|nr:cytochrome b/b6 domain-containing protein [Sphingomicrobium sp.]
MASVPQAVSQDPIRRYSNTAVALHWITVVLVLTQVVLGFAFAEFMARGRAQAEVFAWHRTLGALILVISLIRLAYRLANPPPPFPTELPRWRRFAAVWNHRAFYFLLIALPVTGLIAMSGLSPDAHTTLAGGIRIPVIPGIGRETAETSGDLHVVLVFTTIALLLLHVAAALQQQFFEHDRAAGRMPPFHAPDGEQALVGQG